MYTRRAPARRPRAIHEKVTTREMPPWHADRRYGVFRNDLSLTQPEIDTISAWVTGGAREGDAAHLPPLPEITEGWQIGTPDMVFEMPLDYEVPAAGTVKYQYFDVPTYFTEDRWMQAGEARPGDRAHVHHIVVYVREPEPNTRPKVVAVRPILPEGQRPSPQALRVPRFDFGWQTDYWLAEPLLLPKGSKMHVSAHFDNSAANRDNPDPTATVRWGDQTWEEMMIGFFTYTVEGQPAARSPAQ